MNKMKQMKLPFEEDIAEIKIFELYQYTKVAGFSHQKIYGKHIDYTLARELNDAEELFSKGHPGWWNTMAIREVSEEEVQTTLNTLEQQVETCKFVLAAFNIIH